MGEKCGIASFPRSRVGRNKRPGFRPVRVSRPNAKRYAKSVLDVQETIGADVTDYLADTEPDWIDEVANETWHELGGW